VLVIAVLLGEVAACDALAKPAVANNGAHKKLILRISNLLIYSS
jgi:hypothetical protein